VGLDERDYIKMDSRDNSSIYKRSDKPKNSGYVDVETFMQANYAKAVKERDSSLFTKLKDKIMSNKSVNKQPENKSQNERLIAGKNGSTIDTRSPEHNTKIEKVKNMLNLK
jgi:hypothetical protein